MTQYNIEFYCESGRAFNVRFAGESHASNEVLLGVFYEQTDQILEDIKNPKDKYSVEYDFGDFISGKINYEHVVLIPDGIKSKTYTIKRKDFVNLLNKWHDYKATRRPGEVKSIKIEANAAN